MMEDKSTIIRSIRQFEKINKKICRQRKSIMFNQIYINEEMLAKYIYIHIYTSSSSSCHAAGTDIPDPLSPLLPIVHRLWQVFRATSRILT